MKKRLSTLILISLTALLFLFAVTCGDDDDDSSDDDDGSADDTTSDDTASDDADDDATDDTAADDTAGDDTVSDDTADDDTDGGPMILGTEHGDCKSGSGGDKEDWPESLEFSYDDGILTVTHVNGFFNCCLDDIDVTLAVEAGVITLYEQEVASNPCFCTCPFDVVTQIRWLEAGHYSVRVYVNGTLSISGETDVP